MGKYVQDLLIYGPHLPLKRLSSEQKSRYEEEYAHLWPGLKLLQTLYNFYLPSKYETGHNHWRFSIHLEEQVTGSVSELGYVVDAILPFDNTYLRSLPPLEKKAYLLELIQKGIQAICHHYQCRLGPWEEVYQKIKEKGIQLSEVYRKPKWSPNRSCLAKLHIHQTEDVQEVSILLQDKEGHQFQRIKISEEPFSLFDEINWETNDKLRIDYINAIQSYKRKKVNQDYFEVGLDESIKFVPVTREVVFQHALNLLHSGEEQYEEAVAFLQKAHNLGHGKATNVLTNLSINSKERNVAKLVQTPKKKISTASK